LICRRMWCEMALKQQGQPTHSSPIQSVALFFHLPLGDFRYEDFGKCSEESAVMALLLNCSSFQILLSSQYSSNITSSNMSQGPVATILPRYTVSDAQMDDEHRTFEARGNLLSAERIHLTVHLIFISLHSLLSRNTHVNVGSRLLQGQKRGAASAAQTLAIRHQDGVAPLPAEVQN